MAEKLARTRAKRGGNRSVMTKLSTEANELLQVEPINRQITPGVCCCFTRREVKFGQNV